MCAKYLNGIETQTVAVFDDWAMYAEESARSLSSFLDEILVPHAKAGGGCSSSTTNNPTAMILTPLPLSHYYVCARTTLCDARCHDSFTLFRSELGRVNSPHAPAETFDLSVESPFFNAYASVQSLAPDAADTTFAGDQQGAIAIATLPAVNASANCKMRCGDGSRCVAALLPNTRSQRAAEGEETTATTTIMGVRFYCVPNPKMLLSTVFLMGLDAFDLTGVKTLIERDGAILRHAELLWTPLKLPLVLLYLTRPTISLSLTNQGTASTTHEVHAWRPDGQGGATHSRLLRSEDLAGSMLTPQVQRALFEGNTLMRPQVVGCSISSLLAVASKSDALVLYLSFTSQIKGYYSSSSLSADSHLTQAGYTLHAIITWREDPLVVSSRVMRFYAPCPLSCDTATAQTTCGGLCSSGLDSVITMSTHGTFAVSDTLLLSPLMLYLPSSPVLAFPSATLSVLDISKAMLLQIDPFAGGVVVLGSFGMSDITSVDTMSWSRGDIFKNLPLRKPPRDTAYHAPPNAKMPMALENFYLFQVDQQQSISSGPWLQELRPVRVGGVRGFQLRAIKSQQTTARAVLTQMCTITSCLGCATARLRLLCASAQDCALARCIGTIVQTRNVLCGIGSVMEQTSLHAIVTWRAIYAACVEVGLLAMRGLSKEIIGRVTLRFPTDQFYALMCTCKDTYAKFVGLAMSLGKVMVQQQSGGGTLDLTGTQDVGALIGEDTIKSGSIASLLFNMIAGSTLLPTMALHRWLICTANATAISQPEGSLTIVFGDVEMDTSWMPCASVGGLSNILSGNDLQTGAASALEQFVSFTMSLLSGLGDTILYGMQLSFDSSMDYIIGLVWNIQASSSSSSSSSFTLF
jgi:hypothetical protein